MIHEIIYTENYALIVSDEEMKKGDFNVPSDFDRTSDISITSEEDLGVVNDRFNGYKKVIAHRPLTDTPILEGVPLLPEFEDDDFLNTEIQVVGDNKTMSVSNFLKKYGKEAYKYTEEDLRKALSDMYSLFMSSDLKSKMEVLKKESSISNKIIQSLQQPKRPKYFEYKMDSVCRLMSSDRVEKEGWIKEKNTKTTYSKPKTITNSQGQTELVGEYSYE
jgi:hypothetical protein